MPAGSIELGVNLDPRSVTSALARFSGLALGAAGIGAAFGAVIKTGNDFTSQLNTLQAVSQSTAAQMAIVSDKARQLGKDVTLPGTSATDAARAMTELAKAGFTVEQSMTAAKGTLQLAAAAQIDAGQAATIQAKALQAFGLDASNAAHAADVLANAANASSLEIPDLALGLQAGGAVAHNFGLTLEDTSAALGVLSNAGIRGSDAGTLLKTSLLALTDQGKPAQKAISQLGLTVYDAQGKFVGLDSEFKQLGEAAKRMTPQQYQAATSILFGSDAARLAGIAADNGAQKFEVMRKSLDRQGAAAEVANAKMQGLPGAMQQIQNATQDAALEIYGLIDGPLTKLATSGAALITTATEKISKGIHGIGSGGINTDFGRGFVDALDRVGDVAAKAVNALQPVVSGLISFGQASLRTGGTVETLGHGVSGLVGLIGGLVSALSPVLSLLGTAVRLFGALPTGVQLTVGALVLLRLAAGPLGAAIATVGTRLSTLGLNLAYLQFGLKSMVSTMGVTRTAMTLAGAAASGLVSALGGPLAIGLTLASVALVSWYSHVKEAEANTKAFEDAVRSVTVSQGQLKEILAQSSGAFDDKAINNISAQLGDLDAALDASGKKTSSLFDIWKGPDARRDMDRWASQARDTQKALKDLGISNEELAKSMVDDSKFADVKAKLEGMGAGGRAAAGQLEQLRAKILDTQQTAKNTTVGFATLTTAVHTLADSSASAADRLNALKTALDILAGKPVQVGEALATYNKNVRDTADATKDVWAATDGFGAALVNADGSVNTATANGGKLFDSLKGIKEATLTAASAGANMAPIWAKNEQQFIALARATGLSVDQVRAMSVQAGLVPKNIDVLASLKGADSVQQQLTVIKLLLDNNGKGVKIPVDALTEEAKRKLEEVGVKITPLTDNPKVVEVTAQNQDALAKLQAVADKQIPAKKVPVEITGDKDLFTRLLGLGPAPVKVPGDALGAPGPLIHNADGGRLPSTGPGTGVTDGIVAINAAGVPVSRVDGGEWIINRHSSDKYNTELGMMNAGTFPTLPGRADGGRLPGDVLNTMRAESGKPYQYGGTGNPSWDCSGFMSFAYALFTGKDPHQRWFTTESNFGSLGFAPGLGPSSGFSIGVHNGGGGQMSHMAGTIAGTAVESGGNGVRVGTGASSATSAQFENHYYLTGVGTGGGTSASGRAKAWAEKDDLALQSAVTSVTQAKEAQIKKNADKHASPADKHQAELAVKRAEQRVKDLEAKKSLGLSDQTVPEAPGLTGSFTDLQLKKRDLERGVEDARQRRNEIYADTTKGKLDRDKADDDLRKAQDALAKGPDSKDTQYANPVDLIGGVVSSAITGQLTDALGVFGLTSDLGAIGALITQGANRAQQTAPSFGKDELAKQGPVVPGQPGWLEALEKTFKVPMFLRDSGGVLPHGAAALNLSGAPEWVLTNDQAAAVGRMSSAMQSHIGGGVDASLNIENLNTGMSQQEFMNAARMQLIEQRQRARSFIGRS